MHPFTFQKFSATGNDFILIDNRDELVRPDDSELFQRICRRRTGIGADGVLLIENDPEQDFRLRYINADGSETECGNGARSAAYFTHAIGLTGRQTSFRFGEHIYEAEVKERTVKLKMPAARELTKDVAVLEEAELEEGGCVHIGVPHYILFAKAVDGLDVIGLGKKYRSHRRFQPSGTNVNFVEKMSDVVIRVRTYERGVEDETLSCGTGCVASALFSHIRHGVAYPIEVRTAGGTLLIHESSEDGRFYLEGDVTLVFEGNFKRER